MQLSLSEILRKASEQPTAAGRRKVILENDNPALRALLRYALDTNVIFELPEGTPPYQPSGLPEAHGMLYSELRKMYLFIRGGTNPPLPRLKREQLFINLLEAIDPDDAKLLIAVKDKHIPYKGITAKFVNSVYPGWLSQFHNTNNDNEQDVQEGE